jgi:hypothetical protein
MPMMTPTKAELRVARLEQRVLGLVERGADAAVVERAQVQLERARQAAADAKRMAKERQLLSREIARRRDHEARAALKRQADDAERAMRSSGMAIEVDVRYAGGQITVHFRPTASMDPVTRQTAAADIRRALGLLENDFTQAIGCTRARAMGVKATERPTPTEKLAARLRYEIRHSARLGAAEVCVRAGIGARD